MQRIGLWIAVGMLFASTATAAGSSSAGQAAFFGVGGSWAKNNFEGPLSGSYGDSWGLQLRGGYRFLPFLSAEAVLQYVDRYSAEIAAPNAFASSNIWTLDTTFGLKAGIPLAMFYPYAEAGVGVLTTNDLLTAIVADEVGKATVRETSFAARFTLGSDVRILDWLGAYAEAAYLLPTGSNDGRDALHITAGLRLVFSRPEE